MDKITFEYDGDGYVVDGEAFYLDYIVLPSGILLQVRWVEDAGTPTIESLELEPIPTTLAGATNEELVEYYSAIIAQ